MKLKNNLNIPILALLLFTIACGCNFGDWMQTEKPQNAPKAANTNSAIATNSGKSDDLIDSNSTDPNANPAEKTGIAECDEFFAYIEKSSEEIGKDSVITRGVIEYYKQTIYGKLREGIGNSSPREKEEIAGQCRLALEKLKEQNQPKP